MAPPTPVRRAPYKDFLQPALHRRFTSVAAAVIACAYLEAVVLSNTSSIIWRLFPISSTGFRSFLLFACGLAIIINRIAQYHVGTRSTNSPFQTILEHGLSLRTIETLFVYVSTAWVFSQIYLWSIPEGKSMEWITYYSGDRARLNEKAVFFTTSLITYGVAQGFVHLFYDYDHISVGTVRRKRSDEAPKLSAVLRRIVIQRATKLLGRTPTNPILFPIGYTAFYFIIIRGIVWRLALSWFRTFYNLPKSNLLPISWPLTWGVVFRCLLANTMIQLLWTIGNEGFTLFMFKEPKKNGRPLTSDSKDPNGSLINGLKSKKASIKAFAMWELALIARDFEDRRKIIFDDLERKDGSMWTQSYGICMGVIKSLETRIDTYGKPSAPAALPAPTSTVAAPEAKTSNVLKTDVVSTPPSKRSVRTELEKALYDAAIDPNQPSRISPVAQKLYKDAKGTVQAVQREITGPENPDSGIQNSMRWALVSYFGRFFRQPFRRRITAAVLGGPYGEPSLCINAVSALSTLAIHSLKEDQYGNVQRDLANIIRTLTAVTTKLEAFKRGFAVHWTDVEKIRVCPEVDEILDALKENLAQLVEIFEPYGRDLRLTRAEIRYAKQAAVDTIKEAPVVDEKQQEIRAAQNDAPEMVELGREKGAAKKGAREKAVRKTTA